MCDENRSDPKAALQRPDFVTQCDAYLRIKRGKRLVEKKRLRFRREGARERHPLLLAAGELVGVAIGNVGQLDQRQHLVDAAFPVARRSFCDFEAKGDVVRDRHIREKRVGLEYHPDPPLGRWRRGHLDPVECHASRSRGFKARNHSQNRRLAASARTEKSDKLALFNGEREVLNDGRRAEARFAKCWRSMNAMTISEFS